MTTTEPPTPPTAARGESSSEFDDDSRRPQKQGHGGNSETGSSDNGEKSKRSRKLKRARQGISVAESRRDEDQQYHASPVDEGMVDADVVSQELRPFSYTGELLQQYEAELLLGAPRTQPDESGIAAVIPPTMSRSQHGSVYLPPTELETLEEGQVHDFQSRNSDVNNGFVASQRRLEGTFWMAANHVVGEPQVEERPVNSDNSQCEERAESHPLPNASGNNENFRAVHGEAVERPTVEMPDSPIGQAVGPCTHQATERQALGTMEQSEREMPEPSRQLLGQSIQRESKESVQRITESIHEPTVNSDQHAVEESNNQAAGSSGESSDSSFQNWLQHSDHQADELSRQTSDIPVQQSLGACGHAAVEPAQNSSEDHIQQRLEEAHHYAAEASRRSLDAFVLRASLGPCSSPTMQKKIALWLRRVWNGRPFMFMCELHEGFSALENYGAGPNVHWRARTFKVQISEWEWPPTHPRGARRWSIGRKSDGTLVGMHIGVYEVSSSSREIYDRRIQRDEMRLVVDTSQSHDRSLNDTDGIDEHEDLDSHQNPDRRKWRFSEAVRCCLYSIWIALRQCRFPLTPLEDGPILQNQADPPKRSNRPNRQSTAANTNTSITAHDQNSQGSSNNGTYGSVVSQVSKPLKVSTSAFMFTELAFCLISPRPF